MHRAPRRAPRRRSLFTPLAGEVYWRKTGPWGQKSARRNAREKTTKREKENAGMGMQSGRFPRGKRYHRGPRAVRRIETRAGLGSRRPGAELMRIMRSRTTTPCDNAGAGRAPSGATAALVPSHSLSTSASGPKYTHATGTYTQPCRMPNTIASASGLTKNCRKQVARAGRAEREEQRGERGESGKDARLFSPGTCRAARGRAARRRGRS